jgi:O-acetyl-ADP-ribose deacetylase
LQLAVDNGCTTIAFPNISTGIYGYPKEAAAQIALGTVFRFLETNTSIDLVIFVCYDDENYQLYTHLQAEA